MQFLKAVVSIWLVTMTTATAESLVTLTSAPSHPSTLFKRAQRTRIVNLDLTDGSSPNDNKLYHPPLASSQSSVAPLFTTTCHNEAKSGQQ